MSTVCLICFSSASSNLPSHYSSKSHSLQYQHLLESRPLPLIPASSLLKMIRGLGLSLTIFHTGEWSNTNIQIIENRSVMYSTAMQWLLMTTLPSHRQSASLIANDTASKWATAEILTTPIESHYLPRHLYILHQMSSVARALLFSCSTTYANVFSSTTSSLLISC